LVGGVGSAGRGSEDCDDVFVGVGGGNGGGGRISSDVVDVLVALSGTDTTPGFGGDDDAGSGGLARAIALVTRGDVGGLKRVPDNGIGDDDVRRDGCARKAAAISCVLATCSAV
jgi:hypothetical protein